MGRIIKGANGGFSGKAGSVVGSSWRGVDYIKGRSKPRSKPASQLQLEAQAKFTLAAKFLSPVKDLLNQTYALRKQDKATGYNLALRQIIKSAITGTYPDYEIDFPSVVFADGSLAVATGSVLAEANGVIRINWNRALNKYNAFADDVVTLLLYDPQTNIYVNGQDTEERISGEATVELGNEMTGHKLQVYYFFTTRDGKKLSPSYYAGEVEVI